MALLCKVGRLMRRALRQGARCTTLRVVGFMFTPGNRNPNPVKTELNFLDNRGGLGKMKMRTDSFISPLAGQLFMGWPVFLCHIGLLTFFALNQHSM